MNKKLLRHIVLWGCCLLGIVFSYLLRGYAVDDAYITFRHARNLVLGHGFVFNSGERLLSTTAPLHGLLSAIGGVINIDLIPNTAIFISALSLIVLLICVAYLMRKHEFEVGGYLAIVFIVTQHWLYRFFPLETILLLVLNVGALTLVFAEKWFLAGVVSGFAVVARPDAVLVLATIMLYLLLKRKFYRPLLWCVGGAFLPLSGWFSFAWAYYGSLLPNTLAAKSGAVSAWNVFISAIWPKILRDLLFQQSFKSALVVALAILGIVIVLWKRSPLIVFLCWVGLHIAGYTYLRIVFPFSWYYTPLIFVTLLMAGVGGQSLVECISRFEKQATSQVSLWSLRIARIGLVLIIILLAGSSFLSVLDFVRGYRIDYYAGARDRVYREVADWLYANTSPDATVALAEVGTIGYFSDRRIIDLLGLVTYELRDIAKDASWQQAIERFQPDYVVGIRGLPPVPDLSALEGYEIVKEFPYAVNGNLYRDITIFRHLSLSEAK